MMIRGLRLSFSKTLRFFRCWSSTAQTIDWIWSLGNLSL
jgi:hypothetical protein